MRSNFAAFLAAVLATATAAAAPVPYERVDATKGVDRGNNVLDVTPAGACSFTIQGGQLSGLYCRTRNGGQCNSPHCDFDRVPAGRCTSGTNAACIWPNGGGFCTADPNVPCLSFADCDRNGLTGTCDESTANLACACQGTDPTAAAWEASVCGGYYGICSDGDGLAPTIAYGGGTCLNTSSGAGTFIYDEGCGTEAGQPLTGPRSLAENLPQIPAVQRPPSALFPSTFTTGPIREARTTFVYDMGPIDTSRGGIRPFSLLGNSFWSDPRKLHPERPGAVLIDNPWTLDLPCMTPPNWSMGGPAVGACSVAPFNRCTSNTECAGGVCNLGPRCHEAPGGSVGYLWTANVAPGTLQPPALDVDMNGQPDCPPHCGSVADLHSLEEVTINAVARVQSAAGAQLAFDSLQGEPAGAYSRIEFLGGFSRNYSYPPSDPRCFIGGDPDAVCSACVGSACGNSGLFCVDDRDCQLYIGRCSDSAQPCDPEGTPHLSQCPGAQVCRACGGEFSQGVCSNASVNCRVDADCPGGACFQTDGFTLVDPRVYAAYPNPLAIPVGYNTFGFPELQLPTTCNPPRPGRIGLVSGYPRAWAVPYSLLLTTGAAGAEVRDDDLGGVGANNDNATLGLARGQCDAPPNNRCSTSSDCPGGPCLDAPLPGLTVPAGKGWGNGTQLPVGGSCCLGGGATVTSLLDKSGGFAVQTITSNPSGSIVWPAGNPSTPEIPLVRASDWTTGQSVPGCIGDTSPYSGPFFPFNAQPDPGTCNDPLGWQAQALCAGSDCEGNTGADDGRYGVDLGSEVILAVVGRNPFTHAATAAPGHYGVAAFTQIDLTAFSSRDTDVLEKVEWAACPMVGNCAGYLGYFPCVHDSDCSIYAPCQNRVVNCTANVEGCGGQGGDLDRDGACDATDVCTFLYNPVQEDADMDGDGDPCDNCPNAANPTQADFDFDGLGDACDTCPTISSPFSYDGDMDGVDEQCDTCTAAANPVYAGSLTNRTRISGQLDDDADGRGNACDFDYDNSGPVILATDFNQAKASVAKLVTQSNCGAAPTNNQRCGEFDHDLSGPVISATDFNLAKAAVGKVINTAYPKCPGCTQGTGWSNALGTGGERYGRPICQSSVAGACVYAPLKRRSRTMQGRRVGLLVGLCAGALLGAGEARAGDGVIEINPARALAGGINGSLAADPVGFPVVITAPGSYRLTSSLVVPDANTTAIVVNASDVQIDLNGFAIQGPNTCSGVPVICTANGSGIGISNNLFAGAPTRIAVRDGVVRGMGGGGIVLGSAGTAADIAGVSVEENGGKGIQTGFQSSVVGCRVIRNQNEGLFITGSARIQNNVVDGNGGNGIATSGSGLVEGNTANSNGGSGLVTGNGDVVRNNSAHGNSGWGIRATGAPSVVGNTATRNVLGGILGDGLGGASDNTAIDNPPGCVTPNCQGLSGLRLLGCNAVHNPVGFVRCCPDPPNPDVCYF